MKVDCLFRSNMVSTHSGKVVFVTLRLSEVFFFFFSNAAFETLPMLVFLILSRCSIERFFFPCLCPPGDRRCDAKGCEPAGSV